MDDKVGVKLTAWKPVLLVQCPSQLVYSKFIGFMADHLIFTMDYYYQYL